MKLLIVLLGVIFSINAATAAVYRCADENGKIAYQNSPYQNLDAAAELNVTTGRHRDITAEIKQQEAQDEALMSEEQKREAEKLRIENEKTRLKAAGAEQSQINQEYLKNNKEKFSPYAFPPYQGKRYKDLIASYLERLPEIERMRRIAASQVLESGDCQRVEASDLNVYSHISLLRFIIDCRNGKRISFSEKELHTADPMAASESQNQETVIEQPSSAADTTAQ